MTIKQFLTYLTAFVLVLSCEKVNKNSVAIDFNVNASDLETKAGAGSSIVGNANLSAFGIFAAVAPSESSLGNNLFNYASAERVYKSGSDWKYDDTRYWDMGNYYRFRAFHPYVVGSAGSITVNSSSCDDISIGYKVGAVAQDDLLFAFKSVYADSETVYNKVQMEFVHALAALKFQIKFKDDIEGSPSDFVTSFYLKGLYASGTVHYTYKGSDFYGGEQDIIWNTTTFESTDEFYKWSGNKAFSKTPTMIFDGGDNVVFCIPQTIETNRTKVYFTVKSSGSELYEVALPEDTWEVGKMYTYTLTLLGSSATIDLKVEDWNVIQSGTVINL